MTQYHCGNCSNNCCCRCQNKANCFYCRSCNGTRGRGGCYDELRYSTKNICFPCKKAWKDNVSWSGIQIASSLSMKKRNSHIDYFRDRMCPTCGQKPTPVSHVVRVPKQTAHKQWKLLEKLIFTNEFKYAKKGTLAEYWYNNGGLGCTLHLSIDQKKQFTSPTTMGEFDDWVTRMKCTNLIS